MPTAVISRRQLIILEFQTRMSAIKQSDGFQTNAGFAPYVGEYVVLDEESPESAIAMVLRDDIPKRVGENVSLTLPIEFQAIAKSNINQPWMMVEALIADIKKAIELPDRFLGGLVKERFERGQTRPIPREPGGATVGASITYLVHYAEAWGAP